MKDQVLTIEKMQHLKELGVDTSKASVYWVRRSHGSDIRDESKGKWFLSLQKDFMVCGFMAFEVTPAFTLQDILELLPFYLTVNGHHYHLEWCDTTALRYQEDDYDGKPDTLVQKDAGNLLDTAYEMLVYLIENNITKPV